MTPTISVLIPCYERPSELHRAIASVLAQTEQDLEVVVGDDGSTADLSAVTRSFDDPRVRLARSEINGGISAGRNLALASARGHLISYLDSDDEFMPDHLRVQRASLESAPAGVSAVTTGFEMRYPDGRSDVRVPRQHARLVERIVRGVDLSAGSTMMIRRPVLDDIGPWPEDIHRNEDYDWFLRMANRNHELLIVPKVTVVIHSDDRSALDRERQVASHRTILDRHRSDLSPTLVRHLRAKLHEERAWSAWRSGDRLACAQGVTAALVLDPVGRGTKLSRSALRRLSPPRRSS